MIAEVNGVTRISETDVDFSRWNIGQLSMGGMVDNDRYAFGGSMRSVSFSSGSV